MATQATGDNLQDKGATLALLIDGDNASPKIVAGLLAEVAKYGVAGVRRIYGDWTKPNLNGWKDCLLEHSIQPIQQFAYTTGKNATDGAMIIDAMDLLYTARFDGFCIVSSDSDFARLAARIREQGVTVYGFGERKTPRPFVTACDKFVYFDVLNAPGEEAPATPAAQEEAKAKATKNARDETLLAIKAGYGEIVDLKTVNFDNDVVFWNGTTSGVRVPNGDWIAADRRGLTSCDATSAAFAQRLDWPKLDVVTFSWQKMLGGEAGHGMLVLLPRTVATLLSYTPPWPLPKIFRLTSGGKLIEGIFEGETINTPSMLCVEDYIDALNWGKSLGGLDALIARADANTKALANWVAKTPWVDFLAKDATIRSNTSVCLEVVDPAITELAPDAQASFAKSIASLLEKEKVAYDVGSYRDAPPGLRIWCGATVETKDIEAVTPWLDFAYATAKADLAKG